MVKMRNMGKHMYMVLNHFLGMDFLLEITLDP